VWGSDPGGAKIFRIRPPIQWVLGLSQGVKRPGCGTDHTPPPSAEVKERVELYLYSHSGSLWPVIG